MIYFQFLFGFTFYGLLAAISYSSLKQNTTLYYGIGILLAISANIIWLTVAKQDTNGESLLFKGLLWDVMLTLTYIAVPMLFFSVRVTAYQALGMGLILVGIILAKVG